MTSLSAIAYAVMIQRSRVEHRLGGLSGPPFYLEIGLIQTKIFKYNTNMIQIYSGITSGRVLNGEHETDCKLTSVICV